MNINLGPINERVIREEIKYLNKLDGDDVLHLAYPDNYKELKKKHLWTE